MKVNYSKVSSKGQVTIPSNIRDKMQLSTGSKLEFIAQDKHIIIVPINSSVKKLKGILRKPEKAMTCEEMNETIKKLYDRY